GSMNRTSATATAGPAASAPSRGTPPPRSVVLMILGLIVVCALVGLYLLDARPGEEGMLVAENPHTGWLWLGGLVAAGLLLVTSASWWRAERCATRNARRNAELAQTNAGLRSMVGAREAQLAAHRQINGWVY